MYVLFGNSSSASSSFATNTSNVYTVRNGKDGCYINGTKIRDYGDVTFGTSTLPMYLFALNTPAEAYTKRAFIGQIYGCKIYEGTELIRDFVPCYRKSDNVIGLYDLANNEFYTNNGTGEFIKGADVTNMAITLHGDNFREEISIPTSVEVEGATIPLLMSKWDKLTVDRLNNKVIYTEGSCKKVFTGEEAWAFHTVQPEYNIPNVWYKLWVTPKADVNVTTTKLGFGYSNMLGFTTANPAPNKAEWLFRFQYSNGNRLYIITPPDAELDTIDKFKVFLQEKYANGTPLTIEYVIEPITHDITNTDLGQSLLALATGKGTNYLEITSNLAPSQTDLSYWRQIIPNE
jgi:hypothetical protein